MMLVHYIVYVQSISLHDYDIATNTIIKREESRHILKQLISNQSYK